MQRSPRTGTARRHQDQAKGVVTGMVNGQAGKIDLFTALFFYVFASRTKQAEFDLLVDGRQHG